MGVLGSVLNPDPLLHPEVGHFMLKLSAVSCINCQLFHEAPVEQRPLPPVLYNASGLQQRFSLTDQVANGDRSTPVHIRTINEDPALSATGVNEPKGFLEVVGDVIGHAVFSG